MEATWSFEKGIEKGRLAGNWCFSKPPGIPVGACNSEEGVPVGVRKLLGGPLKGGSR